MELSTDHEIYFSHTNPTSIEDVIASLQGLKSLSSAVPAVFEQLYPGTKFSDIQLSLIKLESGSLLEHVIVKLFFGSQEQLDKDLDAIRCKLKLDDPQMRLLVVLTITAVVGYGMLSAASNFISSFSKPVEEKTEIVNNYNFIIAQGADLAGITPEEFGKMIANANKNNKASAEGAIKFLQPARKDANAAVTFNGLPDVGISSGAIRQTPSYWIDPSEDTVSHFENVAINIRATDMDSSKQGWAAKVPTITGDKRMRMQINPGLEIASLYGKPSITGDVSVVYKKTPQSLVPAASYIILTAIR